MDIFIFSFFAVSYTSELVKLSLYDMVGSDILEPGHSTHGCGLHGDSVREIHNTTDPIERRLCIHSQKRVGALKREHKKRVAIN